MNIHVVVEGECERQIYADWIPLVNPKLMHVDNIWSHAGNTFSIVMGGGYPFYYHVIENAIEDVNHYTNVDRLVIAIDSEEMTCREKYEEVANYLQDRHCRAEVRIVVQHFCIETWALGNRKVIRRNSPDSILRNYLHLFNVTTEDPELLPGYPREELNRAQFAEKYLRRAINDRFNRLTYNKNRPQVIQHATYHQEVRNRLHDTGHIQSFDSFLNAFV
jgi:hypothetical protein